MEIDDAISYLDMALSVRFENEEKQQRWNSAIHMAMLEVEKNKPRRPMLEENHKTLGYTYLCPLCHRMHSNVFPRCPYCGQKIDWSQSDARISPCI